MTLSLLSAVEKSHPCLILTQDAVPVIRENLEVLPLLESSFDEIQTLADQAIKQGVNVPLPKDPGGGYTHEQHKRNYSAMLASGFCYQLTEDVRYRNFVRDMLFTYANIYPGLGLHPQRKNQAPGRLFWQSLNESVWLVHAIQAYDCIVDSLEDSERKIIEEKVFREMVRFFVEEGEYTFNRIHNHATWAAAGVGMTGLVLGDERLVEIALHGSVPVKQGGFLRQIDELFSPDGYYAEGPYYQRYALMPFVLFAQALENNRPDVAIFDFKDGVLLKAVDTLLQLTDNNGRFLPLNDSIKSKSIQSPELVYGVNIAYARNHASSLLSIAESHGKVMLSKEGLKVARDHSEGAATAYERVSSVVSDGKEGASGALVLMRSGANDDRFSVTVKATSQGMGHGHFDRLSYLVQEGPRDVVTDYGSARFLNVVQKSGGRYLPENTTWAKQTVAHNTVVVDEQSQFGGNVKEASKYDPSLLWNHFGEDVQVTAVVENNAYDGLSMNRTFALFQHENRTYLIDLFRLLGEEEHQYDLPLYFDGQVIDVNSAYDSHLTTLNVVGEHSGYQHLWNLAEVSECQKPMTITWMNETRFYSWTTAADKDCSLFFTRIGANDGNFNLRTEPGLLLRKKDVSSHSFLSVLEAHGRFNPVDESVVGAETSIENLELFYQDEAISGIRIKFISGCSAYLLLTHQDEPSTQHRIECEDGDFEWKGNFYFKKQ